MKEFIKNNKKYIYIGLIVLFIITLVFIIIYITSNKFYRLMNIDNIKDNKTIKINDYSFLEEYKINDNVYKYKKEVKLNSFIGDIYYIRNKNNKYNIYQVKIDTTNPNKDTPILGQIKLTIDTFESEVNKSLKNKLSFLNDELIGKSKYKFDLPIEESIYKENRVYKKIFKDDNSIYHMNFYMNNDTFICEIINFIK